MKYLITGANGMLGSALCPMLAKDGGEIYPTDINTKGNNIYKLDIRDKEQVQAMVKEIRPDILFHLAAETNVDKCELEPEHAYQTNVLGTKNIALACKEMGIIMVYIGTCSIFDGKKQEPYRETDTPNPISVYSKTKLEGERIVQDLLEKYFIFRAGWMMGGNKKDKKFVAKIIELLETQKEIRAVDDKFGSPTFTFDISRAMIETIKVGRYGLYHMTNLGSCSRYELACKIKEYLKKDDVIIKPIPSSEFPLPAPRPRSEAVENFNLSSIGLGHIMRPWEEALKIYLEQLAKEHSE
ncbi:MAG: dTDP-4-dehydrorhamnose reductase [Candidatus Omnitrophica bacterium]|nr:dTDP-4-dehydrorhamnose reductase [Candidatus Omnitrophota bacterium]